eukprot:SAG22_NODE_1261_length_4977_cov_9.689832_7_plen_39_part_00
MPEGAPAQQVGHHRRSYVGKELEKVKEIDYETLGPDLR